MTDTTELVVLTERYRDAAVAWFEAGQDVEYEYDFGHPTGCQCAPCLAMEARNEERRKTRTGFLKAAVAARAALEAAKAGRGTTPL